jgi:hypothetical protein
LAGEFLEVLAPRLVWIGDRRIDSVLRYRGYQFPREFLPQEVSKEMSHADLAKTIGNHTHRQHLSADFNTSF